MLSEGSGRNTSAQRMFNLGLHRQFHVEGIQPGRPRERLLTGYTSLLYQPQAGNDTNQTIQGLYLTPLSFNCTLVNKTLMKWLL